MRWVVYVHNIFCSNQATYILDYEIGYSLLDSFAFVNPFIAWRNHMINLRIKKIITFHHRWFLVLFLLNKILQIYHILQGKKLSDQKLKKYGIRQARSSLIQRWAKRCMRHHEKSFPGSVTKTHFFSGETMGFSHAPRYSGLRPKRDFPNQSPLLILYDFI